MWLNIRRFLRAPTRLRTLLLALPPRIRRSSVGLRTGWFEINIELWPVYAVHLEFRLVATMKEANLFKRLQSERKERTAGLPISYKVGRRWNAVIIRSDFKSEAIFGFLSPNYICDST